MAVRAYPRRTIAEIKKTTVASLGPVCKCNNTTDGVGAVDTDTLRAVPQASSVDRRHSFLGSGGESIASDHRRGTSVCRHRRRRVRYAKLGSFQVFQCVTFEWQPSRGAFLWVVLRRDRGRLAHVSTFLFYARVTLLRKFSRKGNGARLFFRKNSRSPVSSGLSRSLIRRVFPKFLDATTRIYFFYWKKHSFKNCTNINNCYLVLISCSNFALSHLFVKNFFILKICCFYLYQNLSISCIINWQKHFICQALFKC
jgi:hypothetical protein